VSLNSQNSAVKLPNFILCSFWWSQQKCICRQARSVITMNFMKHLRTEFFLNVKLFFNAVLVHVLRDSLNDSLYPWHLEEFRSHIDLFSSNIETAWLVLLHRFDNSTKSFGKKLTAKTNSKQFNVLEVSIDHSDEINKYFYPVNLFIIDSFLWPRYDYSFQVLQLLLRWVLEVKCIVETPSFIWVDELTKEKSFLYEFKMSSGICIKKSEFWVPFKLLDILLVIETHNNSLSAAADNLEIEWWDKVVLKVWSC